MDLRGSTWLCLLPVWRLLDARHKPWLLCGSWGSEAKYLFLGGRHFQCLSYIPSPHSLVFRGLYLSLNICWAFHPHPKVASSSGFQDAYDYSCFLHQSQLVGLVGTPQLCEKDSQCSTVSPAHGSHNASSSHHPMLGMLPVANCLPHGHQIPSWLAHQSHSDLLNWSIGSCCFAVEILSVALPLYLGKKPNFLGWALWAHSAFPETLGSGICCPCLLMACACSSHSSRGPASFLKE